jgi:hypothetical protein
MPPTLVFYAKIANTTSGTAIDLPEFRRSQMAFLRNPLYWDKKIKIAILTLATFMALC